MSNRNNISQWTGKTVENYLVEKRIWQGATSIVYKCISQNGKGKYGDIVALKVLHPHRKEPSQIKMFIREARLQKKLDYKNVVRVHSVGKIEFSLFIFMEYIRGQNLREFSLNGLVDNKELVKMFRDIAETISFIHSKKVIHNDIKPENILFDPISNTFKITDFGYARPFKKWFNKKDYSGGTDKYMAPERTKGVFNEKTDIFSFGIIMEELLFPRIPDKRINSIIHKATHKDPNNRYSSFSKLIKDIDHSLYKESL